MPSTYKYIYTLKNNMNYDLHYSLLINKAKSQNRKRIPRDSINYIYYENHHIIPKCLGGANNKENLVLLTPEEHFLAHLLLAKIYPNNIKLVCSAIRLTGKGNKYRKHTNKTSGWLRRKHSENMRNLMLGVPKSKEQVEKQATALRGRVVPQEQKEKSVEVRKRNNSYIVSEKSRELRKINRAAQAHIHNVPICMFGINYDSIKSARLALNVGRTYIINRLKSDNFSDCYYL